VNENAITKFRSLFIKEIRLLISQYDIMFENKTISIRNPDFKPQYVNMILRLNRGV
jgi:hypothetical protein